MDPISAMYTGARVGWAAGKFFSEMESNVNITNKSSNICSVALCIGPFASAVSVGWINIDPGCTYGVTFKIPRGGTDLIFYAKGGAGYDFSGGVNFYVLKKKKFSITKARTTEARIHDGNGKMKVVSGDLYRLGSSFRYTLNG